MMWTVFFFIFLFCSFYYYLVFCIWKPTLIELVSKYKLLIKNYNSILEIYSISVFYWLFLVPCALFTNDRLHPVAWLVHCMFLKNIAFHAESFILDLFVLLNFSLVFEHLLFAFVFYWSENAKNFFTQIFGAELLFFCLGNMWKSAAKKLGSATAGLAYEIGVSVAAEQAGTKIANDSLAHFPGQSLDQYSNTRNQAADKFYNRFSIAGNFGTFMSKIKNIL